MKHMKKKSSFSKILSLLIAVVMLLTLPGLSTLADTDSTTNSGFHDEQRGFFYVVEYGRHSGGYDDGCGEEQYGYAGRILGHIGISCRGRMLSNLLLSDRDGQSYRIHRFFIR